MMNLSIGQLDLAKPRNEGDDKVYCFMATGYRWGSGATRSPGAMVIIGYPSFRKKI